MSDIYSHPISIAAFKEINAAYIARKLTPDESTHAERDSGRACHGPHRNYLSPEEAQRLAGKINLLTTTVFGRLGQAPLRAIYSRSYAAHSSDDHRLTGALRASLSTMAKILQRLQARVVSFDVRC